jgi:hypothetical protein
MKKKHSIKKEAEDKKGVIEFIVVAICIILIIAFLVIGLLFSKSFSPP